MSIGAMVPIWTRFSLSARRRWRGRRLLLRFQILDLNAKSQYAFFTFLVVETMVDCSCTSAASRSFLVSRAFAGVSIL